MEQDYKSIILNGLKLGRDKARSDATKSYWKRDRAPYLKARRKEDQFSKAIKNIQAMPADFVNGYVSGRIDQNLQIRMIRALKN